MRLRFYFSEYQARPQYLQNQHHAAAKFRPSPHGRASAGVQANGGSGGHIQRLLAAGLGNADMRAGLAGQRGIHALPFVPH